MEKREPLTLWWECKLVHLLWKTVWIFLKKLKIELPDDPAILVLGIYPDKTIIRKDTLTPMFTVALFTIAKTGKQPKCSLRDEWLKKMQYGNPLEVQWLGLHASTAGGTGSIPG